MGYVSMRREKTGGVNWKQSLVRIEVDGDKLNSNYKGMPVNYFNDKGLDKINHYLKNKKGEERETFTGRYGGVYSTDMDVKALDRNGNIVDKTLHRYNPHADDKRDPRGKKRSQVSVDYGVIDRNQMHEYEDRLMSNKEYITKVKERGFIKRIDIYLCKNILDGNIKASRDILYMVDEIISIYGDIVHIYDNFSSFENVNTVNSISGYDFKKQYVEMSRGNYTATHKQIDPTKIGLLDSEMTTIIRYAVVLGFFGFGNGWEIATFRNTFAILSKLDINLSSPKIGNTIEEFIKKIGKEGKEFFMKQSNYLKKELDVIPPYKLEKYVSILEQIKRKQENIYALRTGKKVGILTVKINMCNRPDKMAA
jgi:hypothetical protein